MKSNLKHLSAHKHVDGSAVYVDDMPMLSQALIGYVVYSPHAHAEIESFDLSAAQEIPGVHSVLCSQDISGQNQMGPVVHDEPCLAENSVNFVGQAVFLIAAETEEQCRLAARLIKVRYKPLKPILSLEQAVKENNILGPPRKIERGKIEETFKKSPHRFSGQLETGAQEHWYLETQASYCIPGEDNEMKVYSSTQHPSETQAIVAEVLGIRRNDVVVEIRRMGGAFGGKETQANHVAAWSALLAKATGRPVKIRLFRDDDQIMTGKRHPFLIKYDVSFSSEGKIEALSVEQNSNGGSSTDLSFAILERAMFHADNAYYIPNMRTIGKVWKTNLPSNTAFRGFGGPQGMAGIEAIIDRVARFLKKDAAEIRKINLYEKYKHNITHYRQKIEHNHLPKMFDQLLTSSEYHQRRADINQFNQENEFQKKGMALTPVKFGISFTTSFLNQAGALVHIYQDGTVMVNHGGTEMGQGLYTKIHQIASAEFGLSTDRIIVTATNTSKVPNTSATAASSGSDLNGMAVKNAIDKLKERIAFNVADHFNQLNPEDETYFTHMLFRENTIFDATNTKRSMSFPEAVQLCYQKQITLSATGFYSTPNIHFDREKGRGKPFHYFAFGVAVSEVLLDTLTGYHQILRTDILHDVGHSLNPGIDIGQIEGGFIQGVGWCTTEECKWDDKGNLLNHSPDTYKIPTVQDIPRDFRVEFMKNVPNENTIRGSKAVGEPPFMLGLSVWLAIKDAISAVANHQKEPQLNIPATNEAIVEAVEKLKTEDLP